MTSRLSQVAVCVSSSQNLSTGCKKRRCIRALLYNSKVALRAASQPNSQSLATGAWGLMCVAHNKSLNVLCPNQPVTVAGGGPAPPASEPANELRIQKSIKLMCTWRITQAARDQTSGACCAPNTQPAIELTKPAGRGAPMIAGQYFETEPLAASVPVKCGGVDLSTLQVYSMRPT